MKQVDSNNQLWFERKGDVTHIGFTTDFLSKVVHDCWQVTAVAMGKKVKQSTPLLAIETNDALFTVPSPIDGAIITLNNRVLNFPDKLHEDEVIAEMRDEVKEVKTKKGVVLEGLGREDMVRFIRAQPVPPPVRNQPRADEGFDFGQWQPNQEVNARVNAIQQRIAAQARLGGWMNENEAVEVGIEDQG